MAVGVGATHFSGSDATAPQVLLAVGRQLRLRRRRRGRRRAPGLGDLDCGLWAAGGVESRAQRILRFGCFCRLNL